MALPEDWRTESFNDAVDTLYRFSDEVLDVLLGAENPSEDEEDRHPNDILEQEVDTYLDDEILNGYLLQQLVGEGLVSADRLLEQLPDDLEKILVCSERNPPTRVRKWSARRPGPTATPCTGSSKASFTNSGRASARSKKSSHRAFPWNVQRSKSNSNNSARRRDSDDRI